MAQTAVTGAGRGIGRAVALGAAAEGARVACVDIDAKDAAKTVSDIEAKGGAPYLEEGALIPLERTTVPYEIYQASNQGTNVIEDLDGDRLRGIAGCAGAWSVRGTSRLHLVALGLVRIPVRRGLDLDGALAILETVEDELFKVARTIEGSDELRNTLSDAAIPLERRIGIVQDVFRTAHPTMNPITIATRPISQPVSAMTA